MKTFKQDYPKYSFGEKQEMKNKNSFKFLPKKKTDNKSTSALQNFPAFGYYILRGKQNKTNKVLYNFNWKKSKHSQSR